MKVAKLFWLASFAIFLCAILYAHAYLPANVVLTRDASGFPEYWVSKDTFFIGTTGVLVLLNALLLMAGGLLTALPGRYMPVPQQAKWIANINTRKLLNTNLKAWLKGIGFIINLFITGTLGIIAGINIEEFTLSVNFVFLLCPFLLTAWIIIYFIVFLNTKPLDELQAVNP